MYLDVSTRPNSTSSSSMVAQYNSNLKHFNYMIKLALSK
jgi:hypothetical protein